MFSFKTFNFQENDVVWYHSTNPKPSWDAYCFLSLYFTRSQHKNISDFNSSLSEAATSCSTNYKKINKQSVSQWTEEEDHPFLCVNTTKPVRCFFPKCRKKWPLQWPPESVLKQTFLGDDNCWMILNSGCHQKYLNGDSFSKSASTHLFFSFWCSLIFSLLVVWFWV